MFYTLHYADLFPLGVLHFSPYFRLPMSQVVKGDMKKSIVQLNDFMKLEVQEGQ